MLFGLGGPLPFGASQDVEHDQSKAGQQQPQHVGQDTLGLKRAVLGPAGSGWKGEATPGVTVRPHAIHAGARKMPRPSPAPPSPTRRESHWVTHRELAQKAEVQGIRHSPEFKQQRLLQAQQGCAHRQQEDGGAKEDVQWAIAAPQRKRSSREQEEAEAHQPLEGTVRRGPHWPSAPTEDTKPDGNPSPPHPSTGFLHRQSGGRGAASTQGKGLASGLVSFVTPAPSEGWALAKLHGCQLEGHRDPRPLTPKILAYTHLRI